MADRARRIKALIERNIASILAYELKNPHIGLVAVNEVSVNSDNSLAKVYVSFLGAKYPHQNFAELCRSKGYVRSSLAKKMDTYKVPDILFIYDESVEEAKKLDEALKREEESLIEAKKGMKS